MNTGNNKHKKKENMLELTPQHALPLINSQFTPSEAREVLMNLLNSKITFHNRKNLRSLEHNGQFSQGSRERIEKLKQMRSELLELLKKAEDHGLSLEIYSEINIELTSDSKQ